MAFTDTGTGPDGEDIADPRGDRAQHIRNDTAFFGHPRGLGFLAGSEMWERFSFYGMQALLMLYMTKLLLTPEVEPGVFGLAAFRALLSGIFGPMTDLAFAAQTFGLYSGTILVTPLIGAWLGDRVLGRTKTVSIGALLMAAGHLTMASERAFLIALLLLILGGGCFIGNLQAQIGGLYAPDDSRRTRAFGIYLMALNVGALMSPLIVGTLGEKLGFHWGFGAAGIGMLFGLVIYLVGRPHLAPDLISKGERPAPLNRAQWVTVAALIVTFLPRIFANAAAQQAYGIMVVWADGAVDRTIFGWEMPVTWVLTADGILTILGVLLANRIWMRLARRGREPGDIAKIGIGNMMIVVAFVTVGLLATLPKVPIFGWLGFYLLLTASYAWFDPPGKALISRYAPASINGTMFAVSNVASALGFFLLGWLGRFYEPLGPSLYFMLTATLPIGGAALMFLFHRPLRRALEAAESRETGQGAP
ncbi:peptide MFS transporter [Sphingomonas sp.]|uniref:peptide MFS transporter n=1 Tax=Sphingomonas sp. TaxID=28214 RepID=UPI001EC59990|nr:peptide MFS transporter [Sphingomonas sp.]MBX3595705.1 peptide MFS transporter [Sphingomonas sp.]